MSKQVEKGPPADEGKEGLKLKKKVGRPKKLNKSTETVKLDLSKKQEDAVQEPETKKVVLQSDETKEEQKAGTARSGRNTRRTKTYRRKFKSSI